MSEKRAFIIHKAASLADLKCACGKGTTRAFLPSLCWESCKASTQLDDDGKGLD